MFLQHFAVINPRFRWHHQQKCWVENPVSSYTTSLSSLSQQFAPLLTKIPIKPRLELIRDSHQVGYANYQLQ